MPFAAAGMTAAEVGAAFGAADIGAGALAGGAFAGGLGAADVGLGAADLGGLGFSSGGLAFDPAMLGSTGLTGIAGGGTDLASLFGTTASPFAVGSGAGGGFGGGLLGSVGDWISSNPLAATMLGSNLVSGITGAFGANKAASAQEAAARAAAANANSTFATVRNDLLPFIAAGYGGVANTTAAGLPISPDQLKTLTTPYADVAGPAPTWAPSLDFLRSTPGYQFSLDTGLRAIGNSNTARGLSSNALTDASTYAEGLAQNTYGQQFGVYNQQYQNYLNAMRNYLAQNQNIFGMVTGAQGQQFQQGLGLAQLGTQAGAQAAQWGTNLTGLLNNATISQGNAQAAGTLGVSNALGNAASGAGNSLLTAYILNQLSSSMAGGNPNIGSQGA